MSKIIERIERKAGIPGLVSILGERLEPTELQSALLEVYRMHARRRQPAEVLSNYQTNRFVRPSQVSPMRLLEWEQIAFSELPPEFQPVALSPVCPLGTNAVVGSVDQNWAVSTARNTEVVSDATNVLALECALRRREMLRGNPKSVNGVHLAASHQLLRAQRYKNPAFATHFSLFGLCSAGRDQGNFTFELSTIGLHARFYLRALRAFLGQTIPLRLSVSNFRTRPHTSTLDSQVLSPISNEFENVECALDNQRTQGRGYYSDLCFHIHGIFPSGEQLQLADGGSVDWTQQYLSNRKERLFISGIGSERVCTGFVSAH